MRFESFPDDVVRASRLLALYYPTSVAADIVRFVDQGHAEAFLNLERFERDIYRQLGPKGVVWAKKDRELLNRLREWALRQGLIGRHLEALSGEVDRLARAGCEPERIREAVARALTSGSAPQVSRRRLR